MSDDPFDDPLWKEAARRADGYARPRVGYVGFPESWLERVLPIVSNSAQQLTVALIMYRHSATTSRCRFPTANLPRSRSAAR
jgi:hypothetical protein